MEMGEYIRTLRRQQGWTQAELGERLKPPVSKAAVAKWEAGKVGNIKRNHIAQMADLFKVSPFTLMCLSSNPIDKYSSSALNLAEVYMILNDDNQQALDITARALLHAQGAMEDTDDTDDTDDTEEQKADTSKSSKGTVYRTWGDKNSPLLKRRTVVIKPSGKGKPDK